MTRVVVDDQTTVREGLVTLLGLLDEVEVVGAAADGEDALRLVKRHRPDVVLMDLRMPRCDGVEATRRIRAEHPGVEIVVLTTYADDESIVSALRAGARGYLTKDAGRREIALAIAAAAAGPSLPAPAVQASLLATTPPPAPELPDGLTPREGEVLALIAAGLSNAQIALELVVTEATVKSHVNRIFAKTGVHDRAQAVHYAYRQGLAARRS